MCQNNFLDTESLNCLNSELSVILHEIRYDLLLVDDFDKNANLVVVFEYVAWKVAFTPAAGLDLLNGLCFGGCAFRLLQESFTYYSIVSILHVEDLLRWIIYLESQPLVREVDSVY